MEKSKFMGLLFAVIAAVLLAIAGKSCTKDARQKNPPVVRPTIVISPEIVTKNNGFGGYTPTPEIPTTTPSQTELIQPDTYVPPPTTEAESKSKLDLLWEKTSK